MRRSDHINEFAARLTAGWDQLARRTVFLPRDAVLELVVRLSYRIPGNIVEFGVAEGGSTRVIRRTASTCERVFPSSAKKEIYACDSFKGLRERFENAEVGTFATKPPDIPGVHIVEGYFEDSLTPELANNVGRVAFASLDADLLSSTLCALNWLTPLLHSGSMLLFDEFLGEKQSEKRAFEQWSMENGIDTLMIAEFVREPSGWGTMLDRRVLFQVIDDEELMQNAPRPADVRNRIQSRLGRHSSFYKS